MKVRDLLVENVGIAKLTQDAKQMPLFQFLDTYVGELLNGHLSSGRKPASVVHDYLDPTTLDPSEWEDWDDRFMSDSAAKIDSLRQSFKTNRSVPPALVRGLPSGKYMPQVIDGHHRTAAAIDTRSKLPVVYDIETLVQLWKSATGNQQSTRELVNSYRQHLER